MHEATRLAISELMGRGYSIDAISKKFELTDIGEALMALSQDQFPQKQKAFILYLLQQQTPFAEIIKITGSEIDTVHAIAREHGLIDGLSSYDEVESERND